MAYFDAPAAAPAQIAPLRIAPPFAGGTSCLGALRMRPTFARLHSALALCACVRRLPSRFPPFCFQFEILRRFAPQDDGKESTPLPSAAPPPSPQGEGKGRRNAPRQFAVCKQSPARRGRRGILFQIILKKGKITLFPFFPCEHTDGGECAARFSNVSPYMRGAEGRNRRRAVEGR